MFLGEFQPKSERYPSIPSIRFHVETGLQHGAADDATIARIADFAAGDARFGIALLRRAAEPAEIEGRDSLSPGLVEDITDDAETEVHERNIQRLSTHQWIQLDIVREGEEIGAGAESEVEANSMAVSAVVRAVRVGQAGWTDAGDMLSGL